MLIEPKTLLGEKAETFFNAVKSAGGQALFVGGCVRDALLKITPKDFDVEIYGLPTERIEEILNTLKIRYDVAGKSFGVFKIHGTSMDIALPRRESKQGLGHTGFHIEGDPFMPLKEAAARRDFTINAIYFDPLTNELLDPLDGITDLQLSILKHCSPAFREDPLRVLRAMQFIARFRLKIAPETLELCKTIEPEGLSAERIFEEWSKFILKGKAPSLGLRFLENCGWIRYFPELFALIGVKQDPYWHPEGDVWEHTLRAMDVFARERQEAKSAKEKLENLIVGFGVLCHDFGKPATSAVGEDGKIHAFGHDSAGVVPARTFLERMTNHKTLIDSVLPLVRLHMRPRALHRANAKDSAIRRLALEARIDLLIQVCRADAHGSNFHKSEDFQATEAWLLERSKKLNVYNNVPAPIILGRHILAQGLPAGKEFKHLLDACFEAQLDGIFTNEDEGIEFLKNLLSQDKRLKI